MRSHWVDCAKHLLIDADEQHCVRFRVTSEAI